MGLIYKNKEGVYTPNGDISSIDHNEMFKVLFLEGILQNKVFFSDSNTSDEDRMSISDLIQSGEYELANMLWDGISNEQQD